MVMIRQNGKAFFKRFSDMNFLQIRVINFSGHLMRGRWKEGDALRSPCSDVQNRNSIAAIRYLRVRSTLRGTLIYRKMKPTPTSLFIIALHISNKALHVYSPNMIPIYHFCKTSRSLFLFLCSLRQTLALSPCRLNVIIKIWG